VILFRFTNDLGLQIQTLRRFHANGSIRCLPIKNSDRVALMPEALDAAAKSWDLGVPAMSSASRSRVAGV
jgi:hypothetical protein